MVSLDKLKSNPEIWILLLLCELFYLYIKVYFVINTENLNIKRIDEMQEGIESWGNTIDNYREELLKW